MVAAGLEWSALSAWFGRAETAAGLLAKASGAELAKMLDTVGDVHVRTAARLVADAEERNGDARHTKLVAAIANLENAYTAFAATAESRWRGVWQNAFPGRYEKASERAAQVALLLAATYAALGYDAGSVESATTNARRMFELWEQAAWVSWTHSWSSASMGMRGMPSELQSSLIHEKREAMEASIAALASLRRADARPKPATRAS